ncbi:nicotinate phosphoribosyltransferase, partial [bacterium]|nr:nicotinate phosphoribosyltransferase [bacterium]
VVGFLENFHFDEFDISFLSDLNGNDGKPLFEKEFLSELKNLEFSCDVDAVPEGTVVFPQEPLLRVRGPIIQCQLLETALLNMINFQSLIATKASRICMATKGEPVLEFGMRRAQGIDGALSASRAAFIGGCSATSNVLAGKIFGIPVRGTHAHSWVMSFDGESEAFDAYAKAMPNNCVFLVDTYDTLLGVKNAVKTGLWLREMGHEMIGIRLDSGDLAYLSIEARKILDSAGFPKAVIVASNDLDENIILSLKQQGATIAVWGVGTKLATAYDQPALGGVYKLVAIRHPGKPWEYKVKLSEQAIKVSNPGILQIRRFQSDSEFLADMVYDGELGVNRENEIIDPMDSTRRKKIPIATKFSDLLEPVFRKGKIVDKLPPIFQARERVKEQLSFFHGGIKRFENPHQYPVGLDIGLQDLKTKLIMQARGIKPE